MTMAAKRNQEPRDPKKQAALEALLESSTLTEAAEKAGISRKTLYTYIRHDWDFSRAYKDMQDQSAIRAMESAQAARERASSVILSLMEDEKQPAAIRLKAAQAILEEGSKRGDQIREIAKSYCSSNAPGYPFDPAEIGM